MLDSIQIREGTYYWKQENSNRFLVTRPFQHLLGTLPSVDDLIALNIDRERYGYVMEALADNFSFNKRRLSEWGRKGQVKIRPPHGKEITAEVESMTNPGEKYDVVITNFPEGSDRKTILRSYRNIDATCTCGFGTSRMRICSVTSDIAESWGIDEIRYQDMMNTSKPYALQLCKHQIKVIEEASSSQNPYLQNLRFLNRDICALFFMRHAMRIIAKLYGTSPHRFTQEDADKILRRDMDDARLAGKGLGFMDAVKFYRDLDHGYSGLGYLNYIFL